MQSSEVGSEAGVDASVERLVPSASWTEQAELRKLALTAEEVQALGDVAAARDRTYRLPARIEREFQRYERQASRVTRIGLALIPVLTFGTAPLWQSLVTATPDSMLALLLMIELGLMTPLFLAITWVQWRRVESEWGELALMAGFLLLVASVEFIRYRGAVVEHLVEPFLTVTIPVAVVTLARLRIARCAMFVGGYLCVILARYIFDPASAFERGAQEWILEVLLLSTALLSAIGTKLSSRRQWAATRLLEMMVFRDPLTGLANRRALEERYEIAKRTVSRGEQRRLFFALLDMDWFKKVNDVYGHEYGDGVLAELGLVLAQFARRPLDMAVRLGGDEFALLLYDCDLESGRVRLDELLQAIRALQIEHRDSRNGIITCSAGGVAVGPEQDLPDAYRAADRCLYQAKHAGRDRLVAENLD